MIRRIKYKERLYFYQSVKQDLRSCACAYEVFWLYLRLTGGLAPQDQHTLLTVSLHGKQHTLWRDN